MGTIGQFTDIIEFCIAIAVDIVAERVGFEPTSHPRIVMHAAVVVSESCQEMIAPY